VRGKDDYNGERYERMALMKSLSQVKKVNIKKFSMVYVFLKRLQGEKLSAREIEQCKTYTLLTLDELYTDKRWVLQMHLSALRNNNTRMLNLLGPHTGFDSEGDFTHRQQII